MRIKLKRAVTFTAIVAGLLIQQNTISENARKASDYVFTAKKGVTLNSILPNSGKPIDGKTDLETDKCYLVFDKMDNQNETWHVKLGFNFTYCGQTFTHISPRSDGYIALTTGSYRKPSGKDYPGQIDNKLFKNVLALLWSDQRMTCSVKRTGKPGNFVMIIEMSDLKWKFDSATTEKNTVQVKLYEATGVVEMIYNLRSEKTGEHVTHIGISDNGRSFLAVNPTLGTVDSKATFDVKTNKGLGEGSSTGDDVMFAFNPENPSIKKTPKKLLLHYTFDETSGTKVGDTVNGYDGTVAKSDSAWKSNAGVFGGSYDLTGKTITVPVKPFNALEGSATLSFWLKGTGSNTSNVIINGLNGLGGNGREMQIALPHSNSNCYIDWAANNTNDSKYERITIKPKPSEVSDNQWHHWVFTKNAATGDFKAYLDKKIIGSITGGHNLFGTFTTVSIGNRTAGLIDNFKLFNYELNTKEVEELDKTTKASVYENIKSEGEIRGSVHGKLKVKEVSDGKVKLRWYNKEGFFSSLKAGYNKSFMIITLTLKPGYSLSKYDYSFKGKNDTYPCLSVSSGRGFGVKLSEVKADKKNLPLRMIFRIKKGDSIGTLTYNLNTTINVPNVKITAGKKDKK